MLEIANGVLPIPVTSLVGHATVIRCVHNTVTVAVMLLSQPFHMVSLMTYQMFYELDCCRGSAIKEQSRFETKAKGKKVHAENVKLDSFLVTV